MKRKCSDLRQEKRNKMVLTCVFAVLAVVYLLPIFLVLINSFKDNAFVNTQTFALPNGESFAGLANYEKGLTFGNYPFLKSAFHRDIDLYCLSETAGRAGMHFQLHSIRLKT